MWKTLTVLAILLAGAGATFRYLNTDAAKLESTLLTRSEDNLAAVTSQLDEMETQIDTNKTKGVETNGEAEAIGEQLETARGDLTNLESEKTSIESQIAEKKQKLDALKEQLVEFGTIEELAGKVEGLKLESATVNQDLLIATEKYKGLMASKAASDARIASYNDKEAMIAAGKMTSLNARVSQNFSDWNFVVISAGANQGVNSRALLDVKSGGETIAKLQVTNLESNVAVCDVLNVVDGASISTGNAVVVAEESKWDPEKAAAEAAAAAGTPAAPAGADGGAEPAPAPAPAGGDAGDPFGLDPAPAAPAGGDDPFGLGGDDAATPPADGGGDDPFGLN